MKDSFCSYYTYSKEITDHLVASLKLVEGDLVLDPSAGDGMLVDALLAEGVNLLIDALDVNPDAIASLHEKYRGREGLHFRTCRTLLHRRKPEADLGHSRLYVKETDTLLDDELDSFAVRGGHYTKIIANPPYGAWQAPAKREMLKKKFAGHYVKETYSLFLLRALSLLKPGGRLSFIIPDTWLFLRLHAALRKTVLENAAIEEVLIFPSKFFPGINFAYSNLSMVTLRRTSLKEATANTFPVIRGFLSPDEFESVRCGEMPDNLVVNQLKQAEVLNNDRYQVLLADENHLQLHRESDCTLGDVADIVTGFYTGDNRRFIRAADCRVPGSRNYLSVEPDKVVSSQTLEGVEAAAGEAYIPYIKSAPKRPYAIPADDWFVRWDKETVDFYHRDKKARFQNSAYYFRHGIGMPMVKSKKIRAFEMKNRVFDQSIVGIFPKDEGLFRYILAIMNSTVVNALLHDINPTANNSANYVKAIPFIKPEREQIAFINRRVDAILLNEKKGDHDATDRIRREIDAVVSQIYSVDAD